MTKINDPANLSGKLFGYEMKYQNPQTNGWIPRYNGNISEIDWKSSQDDVLRRYVYMYDPLNRLTGGYYQEPNSSIVWVGYYNEYYRYDLNGNITQLTRMGKQPAGQTTSSVIDDLTYIYSGNQLTSVSDTKQNPSGYPLGGSTISYDDNGNMTNHLDKGISSIQYNYLNLPKQVTSSQGNISYIYRADGGKVKKTFGSKITDYLDGFQYEDAVPKFLPTSEGYFNFENNKYIYNYTDHLGNIRLSYFNNGSGAEVLEENNYYAFGLKHEGYNALSGNPAYQYQYNGKEYQSETEWYDYGARMYMPDLGRWGVIDPLAEQYRRHSTYNYAVNNPIRFIDPDGRGVNDFVERKDGSIYWDKNANSQSTTKAGETYLGKNLSFTFNSYIGSNYDGPMGSAPEGDKLTTTINLSASENSSGELTELSATKNTEIGKTFGLFEGRNFYPGEGGSNNYFTKSGMSVNYEQHASVPKFEESGLNAMGFKIVDVAQKLNISFDKGSGNLSINAYTNVFPSATLKLNNTGTTLMNYKQPSFVGTHTAPLKGYSSTFVGSGTIATKQAVYDYSYYPSRFYKRN
jgi:RHS repeat-associated protein